MSDEALARDFEKRQLRWGLDWIGDEIQRVNNANGWDGLDPESWDREDKKHRIPSKLALLHSEVSEMLEAFRKGDKDNFIEEAADVFIRLMDITHPLGMDIASAALSKVAKNAGRGHRHGGKRV